MDFYFFTLQTYFCHITLFLKMQLSLLSGRIFLLLKQNISPVVSFSELHFSQMSRKKIPFYYIWNISVLVLLSCVLFRILGKHFLLRLSTIFYHFLYFRESAFVSVHNYYLSEFVLITYLQFYIFIIFHLSQISEKISDNYITSP